MSTDVKKSWVSARLPLFAEAGAFFTSPRLAREAPYLGTLPALITVALVFMAASGLVLSVYYDPAHGFRSIQFIDRDVNNGWLIHGFHETGTTMIFGTVYLALFRGMFTRAYKAPGDFVWTLGIAQFVLLLLIGWLGYALTDGTASYWSVTGGADAAQRMTSLAGAVGMWFFGGPNGAGTLGRFAVFHTVLALAIFVVVALHYSARNAIAPKLPARQAVSFHPYYTSQYFVALVVFALIFSVLVFFVPHFGENPLNLSPADPLSVPALASPPWYLAPLGGIISVFPGLYGGIIAVIAGLGVLFLLPWLDRSGPAGRPGGLYKCLTVILALDVIALGFAAAAPSAAAHILVTIFTIWYFLHFLVLTPLVTAMEAE